MNTTTTTPTLLHLDASPRGERSHSRKLGRDFVEAWQAAHPTARVITHDLGHQPPPLVSEAWVEGAFTAPAQQSAAAREAISVSDAYVDELLAADQLVITTPIYNLSVPAVLKAWIDQIVRVGRTFTKGAGGLEGLVKNKRVLVVVASGSDFRPGTPGGAYNFVEPYLRAIFGFIGITEVEFVYAHSLGGDEAKRLAVIAETSSKLRELAA